MNYFAFYFLKQKATMFRPEFKFNNQLLNKCDWELLSCNENSIPLLEKNLDKVVWRGLSQNPNAIYLLAKLDTEKMRLKCKPFTEELASYVFHPTRL